MKTKLFALILLFYMGTGYSQETTDLQKKADEIKEKARKLKDAKFSVSGTLSMDYEYYGLTTSPSGWTGYRPRKPYNQLRYDLKPTFNFGDFKIPLVFNFAAMQTSVLGPYAGVRNQNLWDFISNPTNNFAINPKYKWAELQLGTQYLNYSELSTGDVGVFGIGFDLRPKGYLLKFFTGTSQQGVNFSVIPSIPGAYKRNNWMAQIGKEDEGKYKFALTVASGKDFFNSVTSAPIVAPQTGLVMSLLSNLYFKKGYFIELEGAQSLYSLNTNTGPPSQGGVGSFKPFFTSDASTVKDYGATAIFGRKSKNFDIGLKSKYLGAGFFTTGYPFQQPDRFDVTVNTRFNVWKNPNDSFKTNVVASIGERINNLSNTLGTRANMLITNINCFTQFNDYWSLNINYNNFGFQSNSGINPYGVRNVSNDFGVSPTYTWSNTKMSHLLSLNYNYSKYDERDVNSGVVTSNNTQTVFLTYVPTFFTTSIAPDFSILYFTNKMPGFNTNLATFSSGVATPLFNKKVNLRGQLQYTFIKNNINTPNNNIIASTNIDWKITQDLTWTNYFSTNFFKYGDEITAFPGANYLETNYRTGLLYKFSTKKK